MRPRPRCAAFARMHAAAFLQFCNGRHIVTICVACMHAAALLHFHAGYRHLTRAQGRESWKYAPSILPPPFSRAISLTHARNTRSTRSTHFTVTTPTDTRGPSTQPTKSAPKVRPLHPSPFTLHPSPFTLHPSPFTLHPSPFTLHPSPFTLHPSPFTLHPSPFTLHQARPRSAAAAHLKPKPVLFPFLMRRGTSTLFLI